MHERVGGLKSAWCPGPRLRCATPLLAGRRCRATQRPCGRSPPAQTQRSRLQRGLPGIGRPILKTAFLEEYTAPVAGRPVLQLETEMETASGPGSGEDRKLAQQAGTRNQKQGDYD